MPIAEELQQTLGRPAEEVTHWGVRKWVSGKPLVQRYPNPQGVHLKEWPLSELSLSEIQRRWGGGDYQVFWMVHDPENSEVGQRTRSGGNGNRFQLDDEPVVRVQAPASPPAAPPFAGLPGFADAMAFMSLADQRASAQLTQTLQLASALLGNRNDGLTPDALERILDRQATATATAVRAAIEPLANELATLRREVRAPAGLATGASEFPPSSVVQTAANAVRRYKPNVPASEQIKARMVEHVLEHPGDALAVVGKIAEVAPKVLEGIAKASAAAPAPAARPVAQLRVVPSQDTPRAPPGPGINTMSSDAKAAEGPAPAPGPGLNAIATAPT